MSSAPQAALTAPPLPRFRYHRRTGAWRKERVAPGDDAASNPHTAGPSAAAHAPAAATATAATAAAAPVENSPFESTYDYLLRSVKPPVQRRSAAVDERRRREATAAAITAFERSLFAHAPPPTAGRPGTTPSDARRRSSTSGGTALRGRRSAETTAAVVAPRLHPLIGFASATAMPDVYAALARVKGRHLDLAADGGCGDRLGRAEWPAFLAAVGPLERLSVPYQDGMFRTLPSYSAEGDSVECLAVMTLLLDHRHQPRFASNVAALFRAFDVDRRGVVAREALQADVLAAWAVTRTYGNLRDQWLRLAAVLAQETHTAGDTFPRLPELVSLNAACAYLCSTEAVYAAACALDLDGGALQKKAAR